MTIPNYNQAAPALTDVLAKSQKDFRNSFRNEFAVFGLNHIFENLTTDGTHTIIQLYEQATGVQTNTNELAIYSKNVVNQTDQVFFRSEKGGQEIQLTNYQIYSVGGTNYFTTLPGGFIIYFGSFVSIPSGDYFIPKPRCKNLISVSLTPINTSTIKPQYSFAPFFTLREDSNGFINGISLYNPITGDKNPIQPQYFVMIGTI